MLISAIMPTYNRRHLVPLALHCFLAQDWPEKELLVVDDGPDVLQDLFAGIPGVRYVRLPVGAPRQARGWACWGD